MSTSPTFDVTGPLPAGARLVLEASAGTGKTYALSSLAVRFVAEAGFGIGELLLVTFTRAAAAELRSRVRSRLAEARTHLRSVAAGGAPASTDPLLAHLAAADVSTRLGRIEAALTEFDTATIGTIHAFCSQVRAQAGALSPKSAESVPASDDGGVVEAVCADLLVTAALDPPSADEPPLPTLGALVGWVQEVRRNLGSEVVAESGHDVDRRNAELVRRAVAEVDDRLLAAGTVSFDSILTGALELVQADPALAQRLRSQFPVALIDEFQDTDAVQWQLFDSVFCQPATTLVLVGDPKQAIYAFRGGDVATYLRARATATVQALATNQRSDPGVVRGLNLLGLDATFGDGIHYEPVQVADRHRGRRLGGVADPDVGVEVRCVTDPGCTDVADVRGLVLPDLADRIVELLDGVTIPAGDQEGEAGGDRPLAPGDIAVLVPTRTEVPAIAYALRQRDVPVVTRLADSVLTAPATAQWRVLLAALERPADLRRARAACLSWFLGWTGERVAATLGAAEGDADPAVSARAEAELVAVQQQLHGWAEDLRRSGLPAALGSIRRSQDLTARLLARPDGRRDLVDVEHVAELLHAELGGPAEPARARDVLDVLCRGDNDDVAVEARQRRAETDADAVQVLTVHAAKGLEFPVVCIPGMWTAGKSVDVGAPLSYHDPSLGHRVVDVATKLVVSEPDKRGVLKEKTKSVADLAPNGRTLTAGQKRAEQQRLTYVALTRPVHRLVLWAAPMGAASAKAGLFRWLVGMPADAGPAAVPTLPSADRLVDAVRERVAASAPVVAPLDGCGAATGVAVHAVPPAGTVVPWTPPAVAPTTLTGHAVIGRLLDRLDRRWSFSVLTRDLTGGHAPDPADPAGDAGADDESGSGAVPPAGPVVPGPAVPPAPTFLRGDPGAPPLLDGLGGGVGFGTLVHDVLEAADFAAADLPGALAAALTLVRHPVTPVQHQRLPDALAAAVRTPLGDAFGGLRLADLGRGDRLDELRFDLAIGGAAAVPASAVARLLADHLGADDPLRTWALQLAGDLGDRPLRGGLNGSIDLVLRRPDGHGGHSFSVVDYKTNRLSSGDAGRVGDYHPDRLPAAMAHHHYLLQAVLYAVALHRYLRWRLPGYDPEQHLGPVGYLFVRGMVGPDTPVADLGELGEGPAGVFVRRLPPGLVTDLSDLLATGAAPADAADDAPSPVAATTDAAP